VVGAEAVSAVVALAGQPAGYAGVVALAVLLLALALLAVAPLALVLLAGAHRLHLDGLLGVLDALGVLVVVGAPVAVALLVAHLIIGEALAIHLQALRFLARASRLLFFNGGSRGDGLVVGVRELDFEGEFFLQAFLVFVLYIFIEADGRADGEVFIGLDEEERVVEVGDGGHGHEAVAQQV
jgi:hypothetical protein